MDYPKENTEKSKTLSERSEILTFAQSDMSQIPFMYSAGLCPVYERKIRLK